MGSNRPKTLLKILAVNVAVLLALVAFVEGALLALLAFSQLAKAPGANALASQI
jgi:hypothetical protein